MEILVNVIGQKLKIATNLKCFISGSQQFVKFTFNMDDSWDNLQTFAQFRQNDVAYNQYLDANNSVYLPREIGAGTCTLILYGTGGNVRATTNYLTLTIDENILVTNAQSTEITQSLYEQLVNSVTTTTNRLQDRVANVENVIQGLAGGAPIVVSSVSEMTDTEQIYILSTDGMWYYHNGTAWVSGGTYGAVSTDTTLTQSGSPADAKVVGDEIADLKSDLSETENEIIRTAGVVEELECGLTEEVKAALLACFAHVAWISDDGQTYYDALSNALNRSRVLSSIRAVFTQGSATIYDTDELYALKQYLTVTVTYSDGTTKEVNNYTLSGKLVAGTNTITVAYNKKTTTFNVTVTHQAKTLESISATFNPSASITTDNVLDDLRPYLTVRAFYSNGSTNTIANYALSGSLNVGTNTITVTYNNKTVTFTVNVTQAEKTLQSITAVFNQGSTVIYTDNTLNDLKPYLTVTARYSDSTTQTVTGYTLSGTLTAGTSTITASYGGKTATFNVVVTERVTPPTPSTDPIYTVTPGTVFNGTSDYIDTGLQLMGSNKSNITIVIDCLDKATPTSSADAQRKTLFHCMHETGAFPGFVLHDINGNSTGTLKSLFFDINSDVSSASCSFSNIEASSNGIREKIVCIIDFENRRAMLYLNNIENKESASLSTAIVNTIISETLFIGCYRTTSNARGRYWTGTLYDFKVYNYAWSETEINTYLTEDHYSATIQSITATFTQGSAVIYTDSSLNSLKQYLVVTANYSDGTTQIVPGSTLSGTLTAGTSTITASYGGKTATFSVTVTEPPTPSTDPVYALSETTEFNGISDYIDTGLQLMGSNKRKFTIVFDVLDKSIPSSNVQKALFHCMHEVSPWPGNCIQFSYDYKNGNAKELDFDTNSNTSSSSIKVTALPLTSDGVREKFVGIIDFLSGTVKMLANIAGVDYTESDTLPFDIGSTVVTENALIGCYQTPTGAKARYWKGTVYDFKIYNYAWSDNEAQAYLQEDHS